MCNSIPLLLHNKLFQTVTTINEKTSVVLGLDWEAALRVIVSKVWETVVLSDAVHEERGQLEKL